ncbi:CSF1 [[Candida] subhashii]|uniref:CSF1 n=1 Tax=[Candida] subhashii TaxID=561895 RepID=A0A8J5QWH1_9ASCO|nr:CSF1 [[Candida] subhashii]KAG7663520.1 CSF1 [[Candida] subhashii]
MVAFQSQFISVTSSSTIKDSFWIYLVDWVLTLIVALAFIFYFHRLIGIIFSYLFKIALWNTYKIRVNIESLKVSPLGGRLFIKNLTIMTSDMTISILNLTLTWRYWLLILTRLSYYFYDSNLYESAGITAQENEKFPSRFLMIIEGLEIFMYNRTMAYDNIIDILEKKKNNNSENQSPGSSTSSTYSEDLKNGTLRQRTTVNGDSNNNDESSKHTSPEPKDKSKETSSYSLSFALQFFPVSIKVKKGAIVMGNITTPSILVASYKVASGVIDISKSPNLIDPYRLINDFIFDNFQLWMRPNIKHDKFRYGASLHNKPTANQNINLTHMKKYKLWYKFQRAMVVIPHKFARIFTGKKKKGPDQLPALDWQGLKRYTGERDDPEVLAILNSDEQYAKYSLILDSLATRIIYYYDSPCIQPDSELSESRIPVAAPEHGVEIEVSMGTIHYGPWADSQRVPLQNMFFPPLARDSEPTIGFLEPGKMRDYEGFKVTMIVKDEVIVRIPTREPSKDKELLKSSGSGGSGGGGTGLQNRTASRPFGWLEIKIGEGSNISSFTSFVANSKEGWPNRLKVILNEPEIRSSVNHDVLFIAESHEIDAKIGFPLEWNGPCTWDFEQTSLNGQLFFLREHTLLFSDLFTDWASGETQPYEYFRPFVYNIHWKIINYKLYLNINDLNIINNPLDFSNNKYLSFQGSMINCNIGLPLNGIFSKSSTVPFDLNTPQFDLILDTPPWHTVNAFMKESNVVGRSNHFRVDGSYTFFSSVEVNTSNYIEIKCIGDDVSLKLYGFVVRYLFTIRENYFGDFINFKTFEEYTSSANHSDDSGSSGYESKDSTQDNYWKMIKTENDVDVMFTFQVRNGLILLPYYLYSCKSHIGLNFDMLDVDIRFCNYYMDMQADFSPASAVFVEDYINGKDDPLFTVEEYSRLYLHSDIHMHIDGFSIHTHRMFGIPPEELTFFCNWDFASGEIIINADPLFLKALGTSVSNVIVGFHDRENALEPSLPTVHDMANFSFRCPGITIKLMDQDNQYIEIGLKELLLSFNDVGNRRYSSKVMVSIPEIYAKVVKETDSIEKILAFVKTSLVFSNICQKKNMFERRRLQQYHVRDSDAPFHRAPFIIFEENRNEFYNNQRGCFLTTLTLPEASLPLNESTINVSKHSNLDIEPHSDSELDTACSSLNSLENIYPEKMPPTINYDDEDFTPSYKVDPETEYDNFIIELGDTNIFLSPDSIAITGGVFSNMLDFSLDTIMDELDVATVKALNELMQTSKEIKNLRLVNHEITINFGDFELFQDEDIVEQIRKHPTVDVTISGLSAATSNRTEKDVQDGKSVVTEDSRVAFHIKDILCSIVEPSSVTPALLLNITDIEFWQETDNRGSVGSGNVLSIDLEIQDDQVEWLVKTIESTADKCLKSIKQFSEIPRKNDAKAKLVHALSLASADYRIDYDPDVLTRPAYILRAKKEHVRFFDSWKVIAKLRHILMSLPESWYSENNNLLKRNDVFLPDNALGEVVAIFSNWRTWEANHEERLDMLRRIFIQPEELLSQTITKESNLQFIVSEVSANLISESGDADNIRLEGLTVSTNFGETTNIDLSIEKEIDVIFNLMEYKSKISMRTLDKLKHFKSENSEIESNTEKINTKSKASILSRANIITRISHVNQQILLPTISLEFRGADVLSRFESSLNFQMFSNVFASNFFEWNIWQSTHHVFNNRIDGLNWVLSKTTITNKDSIHFDFGLDKIALQVLDKDGKFPQMMEQIVKHDVKYIQDLIKLIVPDSKGETNDDLPKKEAYRIDRLGQISANVNLKEVEWRIELLNPFIIGGTFFDKHVSVSKRHNHDVFIESTLKRAACRVDVHRLNILDMNGSELRLLLEIGTLDELILLALTMSTASSRAFCPNLIETIEKVKKELPALQKKIDHVVGLFKTDSIVEEVKSGKETDMSKVVFKLKFSNGYAGLSTFVNKAKLSFEIESSTMGVFNIANVPNQDDPDGANVNSQVPLYGEIEIPTARLSLLDRSIPIGVSNIMDVNMTVRLLNDSENDANSRQTLQLESQHCRVCLSEPTTFKLISIADELLKLIPEEALEKKKVTPEAVPRSVIADAVYSRISAFQYLSYNFCAGWLFFEDGDRKNQYPGIIVGAERFFAATEEGLGKFTLMEGYVSVANGSRSSNFYSSTSQKSNLNRAFLPTIQLSYAIDKRVSGNENIRIAMHGDELDVKFLSTSVVILEKIAKSGTKVQQYLEKRAKFKKETLVNPSKTTRSDTTISLQSEYASIDFTATFAGSNVLLYRLQDDEETTEAPSLFLHSPAVKAAFRYLEKKADRKRVLQGEVVTSSSENTLYPRCVPVVADMITGMKAFMRNKADINIEGITDVTAIVESKEPNTTFFEDILKDMEIHFGMRIEKQALSLSCEPTARVAAVVGIDGLFIQVNSNDVQPSKGIIMSVLFDRISASLQHIYSREISASTGIERILLTSAFELEEVASLYSAGCFTDVDCYINVKQYQDVELFKDIWFPKKYQEQYSNLFESDEPKDSQLLANKNISSRFREVSTTYAFPWIVTFLVSNACVRVDFGQSLGNFKLDVNNFWAVSKKATDWSQDLKTGIDSITLKSEGRLGGNLLIENINLHTAICWELLSSGTTLDVPLILVSGGIEKLQLKTSFDYHVIALVNFEGFAMDVYNRKSDVSVAKDHLFVSTKFDTAEVYITSLTQSILLDIQNAILRMVQENRRSYKETLRDSSKGGIFLSSSRRSSTPIPVSQPKKDMSENTWQEAIKKLETKIHVSAGKVLIHIYPSSFDNSKVLVIQLDKSRAKFQQNEYSTGISNELDIKFNDLTSSLSVLETVSEEFINECSVSEFVEHAHKANGGGIFVFPSFKISMRTFQKYNENLIEYLFQSTFDGTVDIRWNLGSVNFIREMYSIHRKALESRFDYRKKMESFNEHENHDKLTKAAGPSQEIDDAIRETIEKVESSSKYRYSPLAPPIIEAPQIKELGNATPPLEWFGLHRNQFPNATHQLAIVNLQRLIHEIELQYSKMLGKA